MKEDGEERTIFGTYSDTRRPRPGEIVYFNYDHTSQERVSETRDLDAEWDDPWGEARDIPKPHGPTDGEIMRRINEVGPEEMQRRWGLVMDPNDTVSGASHQIVWLTDGVIQREFTPEDAIMLILNSIKGEKDTLAVAGAFLTRFTNEVAQIIRESDPDATAG